jgi:hypothetical protein
MIVACPTCSSRFQYDDARFQGAETKRFRCPKCTAIFEVQNPAFTPPPPAPPDIPEPEGPNLTQPFSGFEGVSTARRERDDALGAAGLKDSLPPGVRFSLAFLTGPYASTVRQIEQPMTIIGREEGDLLTQDPETSRRHARLEIHWDGSAWLTDLNSTNGTFVESVQITGTVRLHDRQEFTCGKSTFMLLIRKEDPGMD